MTHPKLTLGVIVLLCLTFSIPLHAQADCATLSNFDFPTHWGQLNIHKSLEHYFSSLDRRDGWAAILFSEPDEILTSRSPNLNHLSKEAREIINHFESGRYQKPHDKFRVVIEEQAIRPIHWVVKGAEKIQSFLTPSDFSHFFISRPNSSEDIDYCTQDLIVKSWECWISFRAYPKTVLLKGTTVLILKGGKLAEHWEWLDFQEVLEGWGLVDN